MKETEVLNITISGRAASGKTSCAILIAKALSDAGINFNIDDEDSLMNPTHVLKKLGKPHLSRMSKVIKVVNISTKQLVRTPKTTK